MAPPDRRLDLQFTPIPPPHARNPTPFRLAVIHRLGCLLAEHEVTHWPRVRDLPEAEREPFRRALNGQTCPLINGLPYEEQDAYYACDYWRWKAGLPVDD